jgi:hypothetical protein
VKRVNLVIVGLLILMLAGCGSASTPHAEPTSWLQLVNDNFFWVILLGFALFGAVEEGIRNRGKCNCRCHQQEDS